MHYGDISGKLFGASLFGHRNNAFETSQSLHSRRIKQEHPVNSMLKVAAFNVLISHSFDLKSQAKG